MVDIKIKQLKCKQCGKEWTPRKTPVYQCPNPKCHSNKWNVEKDTHKEG